MLRADGRLVVSHVGSMVRPVSRAPLPPGVPMLAWASLKYSAKPFSVSLSAPLITTLVDATGLAIYMLIARALLTQI